MGGTMSHMDFVREALDFDRNDRLEREAWQQARAERTITPPVPLPVAADVPQAMRERYDHPLPPVRACWQETDPTDPLFRRCGCPSDEPCQGHPDPQRLLDLQADEEKIQEDLPEETGE